MKFYNHPYIVELSEEAIQALDKHRIAQLDGKLRDLAMQHIRIEKEIIKLSKEREALRKLVQE